MLQIGERTKSSLFCFSSHYLCFLLTFNNCTPWGGEKLSSISRIYHFFASRVLSKISSCLKYQYDCVDHITLGEHSSYLTVTLWLFPIYIVNVPISSLNSILPKTPQLTRQWLHCATIFSPAFQDFSSVLCITCSLLMISENLLFWRLTQEPKYAKFCHEFLATSFVAILPQGRNFWILFE